MKKRCVVGVVLLIVASAIGSGNVMAGGHGGPGGPGPRGPSHERCSRGPQNDLWCAAGGFVTGVLLGQAISPHAETTYVTTREVIYTPAPPVVIQNPPVRTVYYAPQPVVQTVVVPAGQPAPVYYQTSVPMMTSYVQQWNGYCWETVAIQQPCR